MKEYYGLTNPQNLILFTEQYYNSNINNIVGIIDFLEEIDIRHLKKAINILIKENAVMRTKIFLEGTKLVQSITEFKEYKIDIIKAESEEEYIKSLIDKPFNILENDLYEFKLIKHNKKVKLIGKFHHIISDAWSVSLIISEIVDIYSKLIKKVDIKDMQYPSYIDYIQNEEIYENSEKKIQDKEYWEKIYETEPQILYLGMSATKAKRKKFILDEKIYKRVKEFCKTNKISEYCLFLTAFQLYICKLYNVNDVTIGTPYLNRKSFKEKQTIGMFINTLLSRLIINEEMKIKELLLSNNNSIRNNLRHQQYSYTNIDKYVKEKHNIQKNLYNILFSYQNAKDNCKESEIKYKTEWLFTGNIANPLEIHIHERDNDGKINILFDYQIDIFNELDIEAMYKRYIFVIEQIVNGVEYVKQINIATQKEKEKVLCQFNNTKKDFSKYFNSKNIINLINANSNNIAITSETIDITYRELINRTNQLANYLKQYIKEKENVGIFVKKNIDTIIGMLAILKLNCTIVPIDDEYPKERIHYIKKNAAIQNILYTEACKENMGDIDISYAKYEKEKEEYQINEHYNLNNNLYIIYTSGSTGNPKPVTISHKNLLNLIAHEIESKEIIFNHSSILQFATMCFDVSYQEIFSAFLTESRLVIIDEIDKKDSIKLTESIIKNKIDILFIPPRYLTYLLENNTKEKLATTLKYIITAGEQLIINENIRILINKGVILYNHYGPAETHVATTYRIDKTNSHLVKPPIGKPISNSKIYVLDKNKNICPPNVIGEIHISGYPVGNGYYNQSELTNQKFVEDPFAKEYKMYKTGDLGSFDLEGNIQYIGRNDFQVKVNGYRIELEEVEKHIAKLEYINNVSVACQKDEKQKNRLIAFIESNQKINYQTIKKDLLKEIPIYMLPAIIKKVNKIPLNHNGKADKKLLIKDINKYQTITTNVKYIKPQNELQKQILEEMKNTLKIEKMGIEDDFFELGGDSLLAISLQIALAQKNIHVNTQEIYDYPNTRKLANYINTEEKIKDTIKASKIDLKPEKIKVNDKNNILLTGATGYLGIHILNYLLTKTSRIIYCIVRNNKAQTSKERLIEKYRYYFNENLDNEINKRIFVVTGDLSEKYFSLDKEQYNDLIEKIDVIINTAASVKHYTKRNYNYKNNVETTQNLIDFAKKSNALLNHISTIGIAGNNLVNTNDCYKTEFEETDLYIGQKYWENVYLDTKLKAELLIIKEIKNQNIIGNIIRVGNLMNRYIDNKFQDNPESNAFQNKIRAIVNLKQVPKEMMKFTFDLTPVDFCAESIVKLAYYKVYNQIYHVLNSQEVSIEEIISLLKNIGINDIKQVDIVSNSSINNDINYQWIINDLMLNNKKKININSIKTQRILEKLNFKWDIPKKYYTNVLKDIVGGELNKRTNK